MEISNPLISCICITNDRPHLLQQAINCFELQTYQNKELLISYPNNDGLTKELIDHHKAEGKLNIIAVERDAEITLGNARNDALYNCNGAYICIWDDDDWHHRDRLSIQFSSMNAIGQNYQASILTHIFLYDYTTHLGYLSFPHHWEGTLFCKKEMLLQNQYADRNKAEDTHVVPFLERSKLLAHIDEAPYLYIYTFHGKNTWPYAHFEYFLNRSFLLNIEYIEDIRNKLGDTEY